MIGDLVAAAVTASPVAAEAESTATVAVAAEAEAAASIINVAVEASAMTGTSAEVARPAVAIGRSAAVEAMGVVNALTAAKTDLQTILLFASIRAVCLPNLLKP